MSMMSAAQFREDEIRNRIKLQYGKDEPFDHYNAFQPVYAEPDYMDFAERYADYVVSYEKRADKA